MRIIACCILFISALSCSKNKSSYIVPDYHDWYTIQSPVDDVIQGVWGNYDGTLLIATTYSVFRSTDKGISWKQVDQQQTSISGIVENNDTLFITNGIISRDGIQIVANTSKFSIDEGNSWETYKKYNPFFNTNPSIKPINQKLYINFITAPNGLTYKINQVYIDSVQTTVQRYETPGVITSDNRKIDLPRNHQLRSLYMDSKTRLYITATDAICDRSNLEFIFCNSKNGQGIVYISKQPLP